MNADILVFFYLFLATSLYKSDEAIYTISQYDIETNTPSEVDNNEKLIIETINGKRTLENYNHDSSKMQRIDYKASCERIITVECNAGINNEDNTDMNIYNDFLDLNELTSIDIIQAADTLLDTENDLVIQYDKDLHENSTLQPDIDGYLSEYIMNSVCSTKSNDTAIECDKTQRIFTHIKTNMSKVFTDIYKVIYHVDSSLQTNSVQYYNLIILKYVYKIFIAYYCTYTKINKIQDTAGWKGIIDSNIEIYIKRSVIRLASIYTTPKKERYDNFCEAIDNVFRDFSFKSGSKLTKLFVNKYLLRAKSHTKKLNDAKTYLNYYIIKQIEKIPYKLNRLLMTSHLLFLTSDSYSDKLSNDRLIKFIIYLKAYYNIFDVYKDNINVFSEQIFEFLQFFIKLPRFNLTLKCLIGIDIKDITSNIPANHEDIKNLITIHGLIIPFYFSEPVIMSISEKDLFCWKEDMYKDLFQSIFEYSILLNYQIIRQIPQLWNGAYENR